MTARVDWNEVEKLMLGSFTGQKLTSKEMRVLEAAFRADKKRYSELSFRTRADEISRRRMQ